MSALGDFFLNEVADLVSVVDESRRRLEDMTREDKPLIDLYLSTENRATYVTQQRDVVEEPVSPIKVESDLSKWLRWLVAQPDPQPNASMDWDQDDHLQGSPGRSQDRRARRCRRRSGENRRASCRCSRPPG